MQQPYTIGTKPIWQILLENIVMRYDFDVYMSCHENIPKIAFYHVYMKQNKLWTTNNNIKTWNVTYFNVLKCSFDAPKVSKLSNIQTPKTSRKKPIKKLPNAKITLGSVDHIRGSEVAAATSFSAGWVSFKFACWIFLFNPHVLSKQIYNHLNIWTKFQMMH